jgi:hypothetical protein
LTSLISGKNPAKDRLPPDWAERYKNRGQAREKNTAEANKRRKLVLTRDCVIGKRKGIKGMAKPSKSSSRSLDRRPLSLSFLAKRYNHAPKGGFSMVNERLPGFRGEYLWEFDIAEQQLLALAEAFPPERYGWRTADTARSVSEILVHVGAGNFALLSILGVEGAPDLYANVEGDTVPRIMAMAARNEASKRASRTRLLSSPS